MSKRTATDGHAIYGQLEDSPFNASDHDLADSPEFIAAIYKELKLDNLFEEEQCVALGLTHIPPQERKQALDIRVRQIYEGKVRDNRNIATPQQMAGRRTITPKLRRPPGTPSWKAASPASLVGSVGSPASLAGSVNAQPNFFANAGITTTTNGTSNHINFGSSNGSVQPQAQNQLFRQSQSQPPQSQTFTAPQPTMSFPQYPQGKPGTFLQEPTPPSTQTMSFPQYPHSKSGTFLQPTTPSTQQPSLNFQTGGTTAPPQGAFTFSAGETTNPFAQQPAQQSQQQGQQQSQQQPHNFTFGQNQQLLQQQPQQNRMFGQSQHGQQAQSQMLGQNQQQPKSNIFGQQTQQSQQNRLFGQQNSQTPQQQQPQMPLFGQNEQQRQGSGQQTQNQPQFQFGQNASSQPSQMFGASTNQQRQQRQQSPEKQTSGNALYPDSSQQPQRIGSPTDDNMQISPPNTPARRTGQNLDQQNSIFGIMNQTPATTSQTQGVFSHLNQSTPNASTPNASSNMFTPQPPPQSQSQQQQNQWSHPSIFGTGFSQKSQESQNQANTQAVNDGRAKTTSFLADFGVKEYHPPESPPQPTSQTLTPQNTLFSKSSAPHQQEPHKETSKLFNFGGKTSQPFPQSDAPATAPAKFSSSLFQPQAPTTPSASSFQPNGFDNSSKPSNTAPTSKFFQDLTAEAQKKQHQNQGSSNVNTTGAATPTAIDTKSTPSFKPRVEQLSGAQKEAFDTQRRIISLNKGFIAALQHSDITQDQSDTMKAYLSEIGKTRTAESVMEEVSPKAANLIPTDNKRKAVESVADAPSAKKGSAEIPSPITNMASSASPNKSQTASRFASIVSKPASLAPQVSSQKDSQDVSGSSTPPVQSNPFSGIKLAPPSQSSNGLFSPQPWTKSSGISDSPGSTNSQADAIATKPSSQRALSPTKSTTQSIAPAAAPAGPWSHLKTAPPASAPQTTSTNGATPAAAQGNNLQGQVNETPKSMFQTESPKAPTPSPFTNSSSAPSPSPFKSSEAPANPFGAKASTTPSQPPPVLSMFNAQPNATSTKPPPTPRFMPKLPASAPGDFMAQFGRKASETEESIKAKRKAEEFDSEEDDEEEWERQYAEKQAEKKRKLSEKSGKQLIRSGEGFTFSDSESVASEKENNPTTKKVAQSSVPSKPASGVFAPPKTQTPNLFAQFINGSDTGSVDSGADDEGSTDADEEALEQGDGPGPAQDEAEDGGESEAPSEQTPEPDPNIGKNLFDRITFDKAPDVPRETPVKNSFADATGSQGTGFSGTQTSSAGDQTWQPGSAIRFGNGSSRTINEDSTSPHPRNSYGLDGTRDNVRSTTPTSITVNGLSTSTPTPSLMVTNGDEESSNATANPFAFLNPNKSVVNAAGNASIGNASIDNAATKSIFGDLPRPDPAAGLSLFGKKPNSSTTLESTVAPAAAKFNFGAVFARETSLLSATRAADDTASNTSRGTSPALSNVGTDAETESIGGATNDPDAEKHEQVDLTSENDDFEVLFEKEQCKAMIKENNAWQTRGVGVLRLVKDKKSGVLSLILRKVPGGAIVFNTRLQKQVNYKDEGKGRMSFSIFPAKGGFEKWFVNVRLADKIAELVKLIENAKEKL